MNVKRPMRQVLLATALTLIATGWLSATEYYVDQAHPLASDGNAGTESSPWRTIGKAVGIIAAGDTAWIKAGNYRENITYFQHSGEYYGRTLNFVTVAAYSNDAVTLAGTRAIEQAEWQPAPGLSNVYYVVLADDPNQVFVDASRYPESLSMLTDATAGKWYWAGYPNNRLYLNVGGGNPSLGHLVEPSVNSFFINLQPREGTPFGGRGVWNTAIRVRGLTFDRLRTGLEGYAAYSVVEDCVIRYPGGASGIWFAGMNRRC